MSLGVMWFCLHYSICNRHVGSLGTAAPSFLNADVGNNISLPNLLLFLLIGRLTDLNTSNKITYFGSYKVKPRLGSWFIT
jgi:hypothetical protein